MTFGATSSEIDELRHQQADVLALDQIQQFFEPQTVRRRIGRMWQSPHHGVVVLHNGPLTPTQRIWVAALAAPSGSALWGGTAARLDGYRDQVEDARVHIVLPVGSRRLSIPWVQSHWSAQLGPADVHPVAEPRRTRLPRSLLDLASDASDGRRAASVLFAGAQQRLVTAGMLEQALRRRGPCRHRALILETLADIGGGIHSVPEKDFDRILRRRGLPRPTRQVVRRRPNGRYYLDVLWEEFGLAVEIDGTHHRTAAQWDDDLDRTAVVVAGGLRQIRFSSFAVRRRADRVGELMVLALQSGGWAG
jgi:very-short-patch-repair endonuclease